MPLARRQVEQVLAPAKAIGPSTTLELTVKVLRQSAPSSLLPPFSPPPELRATEKPALPPWVKEALPLPWAMTRQGEGRTPSKSSRKRVKSFEAAGQVRPEAGATVTL